MTMITFPGEELEKALKICSYFLHHQCHYTLHVCVTVYMHACKHTCALIIQVILILESNVKLQRAVKFSVALFNCKKCFRCFGQLFKSLDLYFIVYCNIVFNCISYFPGEQEVTVLLVALLLIKVHLTGLFIPLTAT